MLKKLFLVVSLVALFFTTGSVITANAENEFPDIIEVRKTSVKTINAE